MLRTATHTRLGIALEAPKLEVITLKARKLEVETLEVVLILEEQVQLVLTRVRDNVSRFFIYTTKTLLGNSKVRKLTPPPSREKFAPSPLLSRPWHYLGKIHTASKSGKVPHCHYYCHVCDITPPSSNEFSGLVLFILSKTETKKSITRSPRDIYMVTA